MILSSTLKRSKGEVKKKASEMQRKRKLLIALNKSKKKRPIWLRIKRLTKHRAQVNLNLLKHLVSNSNLSRTLGAKCLLKS